MHLLWSELSCPLKVRALEVRPQKDCLFQAGAGEVGLLQVGLSQVGTLEVCALQLGALEACRP